MIPTLDQLEARIKKHINYGWAVLGFNITLAIINTYAGNKWASLILIAAAITMILCINRNYTHLRYVQKARQINENWYHRDQ